MSSASNRGKLVGALVDAVNSYDLDGIDIDWVGFLLITISTYDTNLLPGIPQFARLWKSLLLRGLGQLPQLPQKSQERTRVVEDYQCSGRASTMAWAQWYAVNERLCIRRADDIY